MMWRNNASTTNFTVRAWGTTGTFLVPQIIAAATPFIWATNDDLVVNLEYPLA